MVGPIYRTFGHYSLRVDGDKSLRNSDQECKDRFHGAFTIEPRPLDLGGGFRSRLLEDGGEVGGGIFLPGEYPEADQEAAGEMAFSDAQTEGNDWMAYKRKA
jgi:hypothetical protein